MRTVEDVFHEVLSSTEFILEIYKIHFVGKFKPTVKVIVDPQGKTYVTTLTITPILREGNIVLDSEEHHSHLSISNGMEPTGGELKGRILRFVTNIEDGFIKECLKDFNKEIVERN